MELHNPDDDRIIPFTDVELKAMVKMYADGNSTYAVGAAYGISQGAVLRRFRTMGVKMRKRGMQAKPPRQTGRYGLIEQAMQSSVDGFVVLSEVDVKTMLGDIARLKAELECAVGDMRYAIAMADKYRQETKIGEVC